MGTRVGAQPRAGGPRRRFPTLGPTLLFVLVFGALFAYEIAVLFYQQTGVPLTERGERPRLVGEIAGEADVTQTFRLQAVGFSSVTVELRPFGEQVSGNAMFTVSELPESKETTSGPTKGVERVVAVTGRPAAEVVASDRFTIAFAPQESSDGRQYRLRIQVPDARAGQGLAALATREQTYLGGVLTFAGKEQWGDLVFKTGADGASPVRRVLRTLQHAPGWVSSRWLLGALFVLYNCALATFTWYLLFVKDETESGTGSLSVTGRRL